MGLLTLPSLAGIFACCEDEATYDEAVRAFGAGFRERVPVLTAGRPDLARAAASAAELYDGMCAPRAAEAGALADDEPANALLVVLAERWISLAELEAEIAAGRVARALVCGVHASLDVARMRPLLGAAFERGASVGVLSGRDRAALSWHVAKQWAVPRTNVRRVGLISGSDDPAEREGAEIVGAERLRNTDAQSIALHGTWRALAFQGHGKDDSVNLGEFTLCGRNPDVPADLAKTAPRCAYGWPCYKDEMKLIPARDVRAVDVLLSACHSAPLPGTEAYDAKYQLVLAALDGAARTVDAALNVHESDRGENELWLALAGRDGVDVSASINRSLAETLPSPAFWRFGMPGDVVARDARAGEVPQRLRVIARQAALLSTNGLLSARHPQRSRIAKLNARIDAYLARPARARDALSDSAELRGICGASESLDYALAASARTLLDDLLGFGWYYGDRSRVRPGSVSEVLCACGLTAQRFQRDGLIPQSVPTLTCVTCTRCGDVLFAEECASRIECRSARRAAPGGAVAIRVRGESACEGAVQLGVVMPPHLREHASAEPALRRVPMASPAAFDVTFTLRLARDIPAQAYHYTVFAIQNLTVSTYRHHLDVVANRTDAGSARCTAPEDHHG